MAIDKQTRAEILRLYFAEKWKIGTIARQLGVHHGTVERAVAASGAPVRAKQRRASKIDPFTSPDQTVCEMTTPRTVVTA